MTDSNSHFTQQQKVNDIADQNEIDITHTSTKNNTVCSSLYLLQDSSLHGLQSSTEQSPKTLQTPTTTGSSSSHSISAMASGLLSTSKDTSVPYAVLELERQHQERQSERLKSAENDGEDQVDTLLESFEFSFEPFNVGVASLWKGSDDPSKHSDNEKTSANVDDEVKQKTEKENEDRTENNTATSHTNAHTHHGTAKLSESLSEHNASGTAEEGSANRNVLVAGLAPSVDDALLRSYFEPFGPIESALVMLDVASGQSRLFGFVMFCKAEDAATACATLHLQRVGESRLRVIPSLHRTTGGHTNIVFARNLPKEVDEQQTYALFALFGALEAVSLTPDHNDRRNNESKRHKNIPPQHKTAKPSGAGDSSFEYWFATVTYKDVDGAKKAIAELHSKKGKLTWMAPPPGAADQECPSPQSQSQLVPVTVQLDLPLLVKFAEPWDMRRLRQVGLLNDYEKQQKVKDSHQRRTAEGETRLPKEETVRAASGHHTAPPPSLPTTVMPPLTQPSYYPHHHHIAPNHPQHYPNYGFHPHHPYAHPIPVPLHYPAVPAVMASMHVGASCPYPPHFYHQVVPTPPTHHHHHHPHVYTQQTMVGYPPSSYPLYPSTYPPAHTAGPLLYHHSPHLHHVHHTHHHAHAAPSPTPVPHEHHRGYSVPAHYPSPAASHVAHHHTARNRHPSSTHPPAPTGTEGRPAIGCDTLHPMSVYARGKGYM